MCVGDLVCLGDGDRVVWTIRGQYEEGTTGHMSVGTGPRSRVPGPGSEQDLHPEVVLLGLVVVHAHLQHPPGLHLLHEGHVAGVGVEAALP